MRRKVKVLVCVGGLSIHGHINGLVGSIIIILEFNKLNKINGVIASG